MVTWAVGPSERCAISHTPRVGVGVVVSCAKPGPSPPAACQLARTESPSAVLTFALV